MPPCDDVGTFGASYATLLLQYTARQCHTQCNAPVAHVHVRSDKPKGGSASTADNFYHRVTGMRPPNGAGMDMGHLNLKNTDPHNTKGSCMHLWSRTCQMLAGLSTDILPECLYNLLFYM